MNDMASNPVEKTILSSKGQLVLPKSLRDKKQWKPGSKLTLEDVPDGVMVRLVPAKRRYTVDEVYGMLRYDGALLSEAEIERRIDESLAEEVQAGKW
jgi:AbrB family looped-hinge helix DNA binding protein